MEYLWQTLPQSQTIKTVKRSADATPISQSNIFYAGIDTTKEDGTIVAKLADVINQVITIMENYRDDNGKRASWRRKSLKR